jgi:surfactin synthase thioesterase subunit
VAAAAGGIADAITGLPAYPTVLFGHGLGALIAFETARRLRDRHGPVLALFVSGRQAPAQRDREPPIANLPVEQFIEEARRRSGALPDAALRDAELMRVLLPGFRADIAMAESYRYGAAAPLDCPIVACGGAADPRMSRADLESWRSETRSRFSLHVFGGGDLYLTRESTAVTALIANQLSVMLGAMSRWAGTR